jgi:hypothetical protein
VALGLGAATPQATPTLVPPEESSLALVGTVLVVTVESSAQEVDLNLAETAAAISLSSGEPVALGQSLLAPGHSSETTAAGEEPLSQAEQAAAGGANPSGAGWLRFLLGTDQAIEKFNREHPDLSAPKGDQPPATSPTGARSDSPAPSLPLHDVRPGQSTSRRNGGQTEAIDGAIERMDDDDARALESGTQGRVGGTHRVSQGIRIELVGFTHPTLCRWLNILISGGFAWS